MMGAIVQFLGVILLSRYLANKYGKKKVFMVCLSLTTFFTALFYIPSPTDVSLLFALNFMKSLAYAPTVPLLWAMIGDVADHIEYENYRRATGFCFSGIVMALKVGLGLGGALAGIIISAFGYQSGNVAVQNESAMEGIRLASSIIPAVLFGVGVIALYFYPITKEFNEKMQAELTARRRAADSDEITL
jgi:GPH family glycoside/pentoside/hexuronide:cation symporter